MNKEELLKGLNDKQKEAVVYKEGPLLILAGAGSGKTRVLTHRIGYLIESGVASWNILAITFTKKAAGEMRERVDSLFYENAARRVFVSTFHSMCVRLLREDIDRLGYSKDFTIYDVEDQRTLIRSCIKKLNLDTKMYKERSMLSLISSNKNEMTDADEFLNQASDFYDRNAARIYKEYENELKANNALDFDDLLIKTVELFDSCPEVLEKWQKRFRYIMVDEYQDTNNVQFEIVRLLSEKYKNICVVGDDDQSIYKFRGANIENILSFEKTFPGAKVIKLEQNYRSTKSILNAANEVIKNNEGRKDKKLWTDNSEGRLPEYREYDTAAGEADSIIKTAAERAENGASYRGQAVLYRTNAQSRLLEEKCIARNVPYVIVGGVNFYQRKEIKDMLSYMRVIANSVDDLACRRIINIPKRGIGQTSIDRVQSFASQNNISFYDALLRTENIPGIGSAGKKIRGFTALIEGLRDRLRSGDLSIRSLIEAIGEESGYNDELKKEDPVTAETRLENIEELINKSVSFEEDRNEQIAAANGGTMSVPEADAYYAVSADTIGSGHYADEANNNAEGFIDDSSDDELLSEDGLSLLSAFLEEVSLVADIDRTNDTDDVLTMMTLHAAKGLEFDTVYLAGMEDGLFPSAAAINADDPVAEIEEERRLCYVGITRAKKELYMSSARERMVNGEMHYMKVSRFIDEIPDDACEKHFRSKHSAYDKPSFAGFGGYEGRMEKESSYGSDSWGGGYSYRDRYSDSYGRKSYDEGRSYSDSYRSGGRHFGDISGSGYDGRTRDDRAYGAYNSFNSYTGGSYGSLDTSKRGKGSRGRSALSGIAGLSKGIGTAGGAVKQKPDYAAGDRVEHVKFGTGTVKDIADSPTDYKVTVDFDEVGTKIMYAGFAKLKKSAE